MPSIPIINIEPMRMGGSAAAVTAVAAAIDSACRDIGFFAITGHGVEQDSFDRLRRAAARFFALPESMKSHIALARGGRALRGWCPVGATQEYDLREGLYFGLELSPDDPRVRAGLPLHGPNLFPAEPSELRPLVLDWIERVTALGHLLMEAIAIWLQLPRAWFRAHVTADPVVLFRIFYYPPSPGIRWSFGQHIDNGLLTLLAQDEHEGLEIETPSGWIEVPAPPGVFVCNIGYTLERITAGRYRSTRHRARNRSAHARLSFPLFFDPSWTTPILPLPEMEMKLKKESSDPRSQAIRYGDLLMADVLQDFPALLAE